LGGQEVPAERLDATKCKPKNTKAKGKIAIRAETERGAPGIEIERNYQGQTA